MKPSLRLTVAAFGLVTLNASAATLYVSLQSTNPVPPFAAWATAATNIQDAVDASKDGDTVLVTNGVYSTGGRSVGTELMTNRVTIQKMLRLQSVNGPAATIIKGTATPPVRCAYLRASNVVLSGFTLTKGDTGAWGGVLTNCLIIGNSGVGVSQSTLNDCTLRSNTGGGAQYSTLSNCTVSGNSAGIGGGVSHSTLYNCTLSSNSARSIRYPGFGGGAYASTLYFCTLTGNSVYGGPEAAEGGGASESMLYNCTLAYNSASWGVGGGTYRGSLYNCTLSGNSADIGGGAYLSTLLNCVLSSNSVHGNPLIGGGTGGGASDSTLFNCTLSSNSASDNSLGGVGGGASRSTLYNCIVYYNTDRSSYWTNSYNDWFCTLNYCCTTPFPTNGVGNITNSPLLVDSLNGNLRLQSNSPCIDAGMNLLGLTFTNISGNMQMYPGESTDILGNTRFIDGNRDGVVAWDIGAYEFDLFERPRFTLEPKLTSNGWSLNITGAPNKWTRLQRSSDLKSWADIWSGFLGSDGGEQCSDGDLGQQAMFYRVVAQ